MLSPDSSSASAPSASSCGYRRLRFLPLLAGDAAELVSRAPAGTGGLPILEEKKPLRLSRTILPGGRLAAPPPGGGGAPDSPNARPGSAPG